jgi:hypothetical protein
MSSPPFLSPALSYRIAVAFDQTLRDFTAIEDSLIHKRLGPHAQFFVDWPGNP